MKTITIDETLTSSSGILYSAKYFAHRVRCLETALEEIERVALVSEGTAFYAMVARMGLDGEYVGDTEPRSEF